MLYRRFDIFQGIGSKLSDIIRRGDISDWQDFLRARNIPGLSPCLKISVEKQIAEWQEAIKKNDLNFLCRRLPRCEHWSLYEIFRNHVRYLDIETTGLSAHTDQVTVVGIYDGHKYKSLVKGKNLTALSIQKALKGCKLLVTYFGSVFDVPFLKRSFPSLRLDFPHFDLCFAARRIGLSGGLKEVERSLGIRRPRSIVQIDGLEAVRLWHAYCSGKEKALKLLTRYNEEDTQNLERVATEVYQRLRSKYCP